MTTKEIMEILSGLYDELCEYLVESKNYVKMDSCNIDLTQYCVPAGTEDLVTYKSKPENSIRISDHWSWYSNIKKCRDESYIQCHNVDVPDPRERLDYGKASKPRRAAAIAVFKDGAYHTVAGSVYSREDNMWVVNLPTKDELIVRVNKLIG